MTELKKSITSHIDKEWQKRWDREGTCKVAKSFLPNIDRKRLNRVKKESVLNLQLIMAILTGHGFFSAHLNKLTDYFHATWGLFYKGTGKM